MLKTIETIYTIVGWALAAIVFVVAQFRNKKIKREIEKISTELEKNKTEQSGEENKMAKFLCDKCGKEIEVKDAKHIEINGDTFDICEDCEKKIIPLLQKEKEAAEALEKAKKELAEAKKNVYSGIKKEDEIQDVLSKLGLE